ncbi:MAG: hypothetical protein FWE22_06075 [Firmicutes bacterium]|nr:hypothetical protein [Bacillota bacterium]
MDKYDGMNKVAVDVSKAESRLKKKRGGFSAGSGLFYKTLIGGVLLALIFSLQLIPLNFASSTRNAIRTAITFDMMGSDREVQGEIAFVEGIRELRSGESEESDEEYSNS